MEHTPVRKSALAKTTPALLAVDKVDVRDEEDGREPLCNNNRDGRANEAPTEVPDKEPVHEGVERGRDQEHVGGSMKEALRLDEAFAALEDDESGNAEQIHLQVETSQLGGAVLGHHQG